jgi:hypothetical protein
MSLLFSSTADGGYIPGAVVGLVTENPRPFLVLLAADAGGGNPAFEGITTAANVEQSVAAQYQTSLDRTVYVTPFGDAPGTLSANFILNDTCDSNQAGEQFDAFCRAYQNTKLSPDSATQGPLLFVLGRTAYVGFIAAYRVGITAESAQRLIQATIQAIVWEQ